MPASSSFSENSLNRPSFGLRAVVFFLGDADALRGGTSALLAGLLTLDLLPSIARRFCGISSFKFTSCTNQWSFVVKPCKLRPSFETK